MFCQRRSIVRRLLPPALLTLFALVACATPQPPLATDAVRIELTTLRPMDQLSAHRLNHELVRGLRFADLPPGAHRLEVRLRYEARGSASRVGILDANRRSCILALEYAEFAPGQTYRIVANQLGWQSVAWLETAEGEKLASARVVTCGPAI
jgi:hypothetical protein